MHSARPCAKNIEPRDQGPGVQVIIRSGTASVPAADAVGVVMVPHPEAVAVVMVVVVTMVVVVVTMVVMAVMMVMAVMTVVTMMTMTVPGLGIAARGNSRQTEGGDGSQSENSALEHGSFLWGLNR
jgi:hypothetical protein